MSALREKSVAMTAYLEDLLLRYPLDDPRASRPFTIITPADPEERGAQLSIKLEPELLDTVLAKLEQNGVVTDERRPDVIRVAAAPLYNSYLDVWKFAQIFHACCQEALSVRRAEIMKQA